MRAPVGFNISFRFDVDPRKSQSPDSWDGHPSLLLLELGELSPGRIFNEEIFLPRRARNVGWLRFGRIA